MRWEDCAHAVAASCDLAVEVGPTKAMSYHSLVGAVLLAPLLFIYQGQIAPAERAHLTPCAGHPPQPDGDTLDMPGQSHSADGRAKNGGLLFFRTSERTARRQKQVQPGDMGAEGAIDMMVLAVDIRGDGAA